MENLDDAKKMPEIDLTKVANAEALKATGDQFSRTIQESGSAENARAKAKKKFCFDEAVSFMLPSGGKFYQDSPDKDLREGIIKLRPMSLADEEILTNKAYSKNGSTFRVLFDTCMASNYEAKKLLAFDSVYIMYILRKISYGDDYTFEITCGDCDNKFEHTLNISDIEWEEFDDDVVDVREIKLPRSQFTVTMRLPRLETEEAAERFKQQHSKNKLVSDTVAAFISRTISIKDENDEEIDPKDWIDFFASLPAIDKTEINKSFKGTSNSPTFTAVCPECGNEMTMNVPIQEDFFRA